MESIKIRCQTRHKKYQPSDKLLPWKRRPGARGSKHSFFLGGKVLGQIEELNPTVLFTYSIFKPLALTYADAGRRTCEIRLCRACPQCQNLHARLCSAASLLVMSEKKSFYPGRRRLSGRWLETVMATDAADFGSVLQ
jgi:hypothetical protein